MRYILLFTALLSLTWLGSATDAPLCKAWKKQGKKHYCNKPSFAKFCPDSAVSDCSGKKGGSSEEGGGGGLERGKGSERGPPLDQDNPEVCAKWKKAGPQEYCFHQLLADYCPQTAYECSKMAIGRNDLNLQDLKTTPKPKEKKEKQKKKEKKKEKTEEKQKQKKKEKKKEKKTTKATTTTTTTTTTTPLTFEKNWKECCLANGVKSACIGFCEVPRNIEGMCDKTNNCEDDFITVNYCAQNNHDYSKCCADRGVRLDCAKRLCGAEPFPHPMKLPALRDCVDRKQDIIDACLTDEFTGTKDWETRTDWKEELWTPGIKQAVVNIYCKDILKAKANRG